MPSGFSLSTALLAAVLPGIAATVYLWRVQRPRAEAAAGIEALAGMRWRECARLAVEALQRRGFQPESVEQTLQHKDQPELRLRRNGAVWLLACKQGGGGYTVTRSTVLALADAIRFNGAEGGLLVTPGRIETDARSVAAGIELYDGHALWKLLSPLLPPTLRADLTAQARKRSAGMIGLAWMAALALGAGAGWMPDLLRNSSPAISPTAPASAVATAATAPAEPALIAPAPADPNREPFERSEVIRAVDALPGVDRALWSTASTLQVELVEDDGRGRVPEICAILARYDALRASRLQLQPPPGSGSKVRFLQCRAY